MTKSLQQPLSSQTTQRGLNAEPWHSLSMRRAKILLIGMAIAFLGLVPGAQDSRAGIYTLYSAYGPYTWTAPFPFNTYGYYTPSPNSFDATYYRNLAIYYEFDDSQMGGGGSTTNLNRPALIVPTRRLSYVDLICQHR